LYVCTLHDFLLTLVLLLLPFCHLQMFIRAKKAPHCPWQVGPVYFERLIERVAV
jgi:hypothetical protein